MRQRALRSPNDSGLYIMSLGLHGLVRSTDIELGRDADTGGQTAYMVDQARALIAQTGVDRVDLVTRLIEDKRINRHYAAGEEAIEGSARIVRLPFGPRRYLHKENLWPYLDAAVDQLLRYVRSCRRSPDIIHGHYADAGYVGSRLSKILALPFVFTGHSLGRVKRSRLSDEGGDPKALEERYHFTQRIEAEEQALETAAAVIASTRQEVRGQYERYDHYHPERMKVIPPGVDLSRFHPPPADWNGTSVKHALQPFLVDLGKPVVLALARPDERKNFATLIRAYAENLELRRKANLVLVMGTRTDTEEMGTGPRRVFRELFHLIDRYNLYGSVAYPKQLQPQEVPELYRFVAKSRGILVNPALTEPFGLTLIEAAATGLPTVATSDGGPQDILRVCKHGELVDPLNEAQMGKVILSALQSERRWNRWAENGPAHVHRFSWKVHADDYLRNVKRLLRTRGSGAVKFGSRDRLTKADRMLVVDLDDTLTGDTAALQAFFGRFKRTAGRVIFVVVTGRSLGSAAPILNNFKPHPDIAVLDSGTQICFGWPETTSDDVWMKHINHDWQPREIRQALAELPGIRTKPRASGRFRVSCRLDPKGGQTLVLIRKHLRQSGLRVTPILDRGTNLDVIPIRASPGLALRFLGVKLDLPPERTLVAGDSGNDADMLSGNTLGVVVGNYKPEIEYLRRRPRIYFAEASHAQGVLEGIAYYDFFGQIRIPQEESPS